GWYPNCRTLLGGSHDARPGKASPHACRRLPASPWLLVRFLEEVEERHEQTRSDQDDAGGTTAVSRSGKNHDVMHHRQRRLSTRSSDGIHGEGWLYLHDLFPQGAESGEHSPQPQSGGDGRVRNGV